MKLNKKLFGRSLYKIATILFLVGYNFAPAVFAIGDISKLEGDTNQSVPVTTEETSEVLNEVPVDTSGDIIKGGGVSTFRNLSTSKNAIRSGEYTVGATSGKWTETNNNWIVYGLNTDHISWGNRNSNDRSGLKFIGSNAQSFNEGQEFELGTLKHINKPISGSAITQAKLVVNVDFSNPNLDPKEFTFNMKINETPNSGVCADWHTEGKPPCDDMITFPTSFSNETFTMNGKQYLLEITGFIKDGVQVNEFITHERETNTAVIKAKLTSLPEKVTICHANGSHTNQYVVNTPDANGSVGGHNEHNGPIWYPQINETWGDIIPQFYYFDTAGNVRNYPGKNNTAYGLSILENGCKFPKGKITVNKVVVSAGESDSFTVTGSGTPSVADYPVGKPTFIDSNVGTISENSPAIFNVYPGTYSFTETEKDGWVETENTCNDIVVANNDEKSCTITNTKASKLTIIKHAEQPGDTSFGFTATGTGLSNFSLTDNSASTDPEKVFTKLLPGEYSVTENPKDGWHLKSATCDNGQTPDKLNLTAGSDVTCTFTNTKYGSITIVKDARPSSEQVFSFTTKGTGLSNFTLIDNYDDSNPSKVFENLLPGTYSVTEDNASGWDLTSATCRDGSLVSAINLSAGENVTCTFVNVKRGSISGHKYYDEDGKAETTNDRHPVQGWTIFIDANNNEVLDDGEASEITGADGKYTFSNIKPGTYKIVEVMKVGWVKLTGLTQTITIVAGENRENVDFVNIEYPTIQVIKKVDTNGDGTVDQENATDWEWKLDGTTYQTGIAPVSKMPGTYSLSETQKPNYHVTSLVCKNGETEIVNAVSESASITLKSGDKVVCTFTNARNLGQLIVKKVVVNDNGGILQAKDFSFQIGSETPISFEEDGENEYTRYAGLTYSIKEVEENKGGYTTTYDNCTNVTVPHNGTATCTITNNDIAPSLTVKKHVKNDNGGTAKVGDFGITLTDTTLTFDEGVDAGEEVTTYTANPTVVSNKAYTLSEIDHAGYDEGTWSCTDNSDGSSVSMPFTLSEGQSVTCEITNDDIAPKLTLNKIVSNTHGGNNVESDWTLTATSGTEILSGLGAAGDSDVVSESTFKAGTYTLSEEGPSGYDASAWTCTGTGTQSDSTITLGVGQEAVCTITNSDKSQDITIIKKVINDNGGNATVDDFNITLTDTLLTFGTGVVEGTTTTYTTTVSGKSNKEYTLSEVVAGTGYTMDSLSCTVGTDGVFTLTEGQNVTCTIVNNDIAPDITIIKKVINDNGGNATVDDFNITLTDTLLTFGTGVVEGTTTTYTTTVSGKSNKEYTLSEVVAGTGYTMDSLSCTVGTDGVFTLTEGQNVTCTIVNDDIAPKLTVIKHVDNEGNDGTKSAGNFQITVTGTNVSNPNFDGSESGVTVTLNQGEFKVTEVEDTENYTAKYEGCEGTINVGEEKTCTITNKGIDHKPTIEVTKEADKTSVDETGENVTFTFTVKNTSKVDTVEILSLVDSVFGDLAGDDDCKVGTELAPNATCTFTITELIKGDAVGPSHYNEFTATVKDEEGNETSDKDDETVEFEDVKPEIEVTKTADPKSVPETGGDVTFTFVVKNTGTEKVTLNSLIDDKFGDLNGKGTCITPQELEVGDNYTCTYIVHLSADDLVDHVNVVTATATDNDGTSVTEEDDETVEFEDVKPEIEVTKTADPKSVPETGGDVTFTFVVKNKNKEAVEITYLNDSVYGNLDGDDDCKVGVTLAGESSCSFEQTFTIPSNTAGDLNAPTVHKNIFTAKVKDNDGNEDEDEDEEEVTLTPVPSLKLVKKVVHKYNSDESITANDWTLSASGEEGFSYVGDKDEYRFVKAGVEYTLSESDTHSGKFEASDWVCSGGLLSGNVLKLEAEDDVVCTITNTALPATVKVYKDVVDGNDDIYSNAIFTVKLGDEKGEIRDTEQEPLVATFENLDAGEYNPEEIDIPDGYISKGCVPKEGEDNTVGNGETLEFVCTNRIIDPILEIEKSNNQTGIDLYAGNEVIYTIKVTAPKDELDGTYVLNDVVVSDIAPAGFKYILGTWTAKKKGVDIVIPEPAYNGTDTAQWELGGMVEGDEIVLTYTTKISLLTDPGVYPDIAWVKGISLSGTNVLGNVSTGVDTPFVGTDVKVIEDDTPEEGEVLGASITLPNTGASTYITLGALIMMILGAISLLFKPFKKLKYTLLASVVVFGMFLTVLPTKVSAGFLTVKIETPISLTNKATFNIDFTAQDVEERHITVECYKDAVKFASFDKVNAGACPVTVDASGTYKFFVKAIAGADEKQSNEVTVEVNLEKPSPIIDYSKAGNVLKFKTANDGKTAKVEIHRSEKPSYTVNKGTEIHTMPVAPNTEYTWTDATAEPGKTYYYALRSLDAFGNVSTMVSDPEVKVTQEATTTTPRATGTTVAGAETKTEGEVKGDTDEEIMEIEEVKEGKEKVKDGNEGEEKEVELTPSYKKYWYIWVPAILLVLGVVYIYVKRSKEE